MAQLDFSGIGKINELDDNRKIQAYLYKLSEQLTYMFNNLDPDDNFSSEIKEQYTKMLSTVTDIETEVANLETKVNNLDKRLKALGG